MPPKRRNTGASSKAAAKKRKVAQQAQGDAMEVDQEPQPSNSRAVDKARSTSSSAAASQLNAQKMPTQRKDTDNASAHPAAATATNDARTETSASPRFVGKFDLYSTKLPFLRKHYLPEGQDEPQFEAVYKEILKWQAKNDWSIRIALEATSPDAKAGEYGMFSCRQVYNPLSDEEITPIHITNGQAKMITIGSTQTAHKSTAGEWPGFIARLALNARVSEQCNCGMIKSGTGTLKMHKVWEGRGENGEQVELLEGYFFFVTENGSTLRRKGWGSRSPYSSPFWGVRARKNEKGEEIGIDAGDGTYRSTGDVVDNCEDFYEAP
ncbi:hypothetical protein NM688_g5262 [Phlebia brevispora]|uniref:Uncharacterized protein n=1 Tax=Phlebia brevispora TaxID=194682 RepID=A0ACC1SY56_9APHY|nr:hypothetical protein NM688_g5262 [Phlebia brevispora]